MLTDRQRQVLQLMYRVRSGDTLSDIAQQQGLQWQDLYAANRDVVKNPNKIKPGQQLRIPNAAGGVTRIPRGALIPPHLRPDPTPDPLPSQGYLPTYPADGFVFHHSGGSTLSGLRATLLQRGLGSQYLMDRDGTIYNFAGPGSPHIKPNDMYGGRAPGLSNANAVGMEVVARDNNDVTPAQIDAARRFIASQYPSTPVYGHGEVNPGHKQPTEGMAIVNAIRGDRNATPIGQSTELASNE